jgi:hypothetical protein
MWFDEDDGKPTQRRAEEAYAQAVKLHRDIDKGTGGDGWFSEDAANTSLGRNILREEIGHFGPWDGQVYHFDAQTRDRLLAHGRQDAASAFAMARSAFREAREAKRLSARALRLLVLAVALNGVTLVAFIAEWSQRAN